MRTSIRMVALGCALGGWLTLAGAAEQEKAVSVTQAIGALASPDQPARLRAIDQLGVLGAKAAPAVAPLAGLLQDPSPMVRARAAQSLGKIGAAAKSAAPALVALTKDPDETVRRQAVKALGRIRPGLEVTGPIFARLLEDPDPGVRMRVLNAIAEAGADAVPGLVQALKGENSGYWACVVLREIGPAAKAAVPALTAKLKAPQPAVRREAILALAAMDQAAVSAVPQIAACLDEEPTRIAATYALGRIGHIPAGAEAKIRQAVKNADKLLSTTSLWTLARVHPEDKSLQREAAEQLVQRIKDGDANVRVTAARALAALPGAVDITPPILQKSLQDADPVTVHHALDAMAAFGARAVPGLTNALKHESIRAQVANVLGQIGPAAAPATAALAKLLDDKDPRVATEVALALAKIGPAASDAVPALAKAVQQPDGAATHVSAYALGRIGPKAAAAEPQLLRAVQGKDDLLALVSAWTLTQIRPGCAETAAKVMPVLVRGLASPLAKSREAAAEALGNLGSLAKQAVPALEKASKDENADVRQAAVRALDAIRVAAPQAAVQKPAVQKPAATKPAATKPAAQKPAAQKPAAQKPAAQKPATDAATPLQRGSVVVTLEEGVAMRAGTDVVARLPKGLPLKVLETRGPLVGVQIELDGQFKTGWVLRTEVGCSAARPDGR